MIKYVPICVFLALLVTGGVTTFISCKKETPCSHDGDSTCTFLFDRDKIQYTGGETFKLMSNVGDTVTLIGQGRQVNFFSRIWSEGPSDCKRRNRDYYADVSMKFGTVPQLQIEQFAYRADVSITFEGRLFEGIQAGLSGPSNLIFYKSYDSLAINNIYYKKVFEVWSTDSSRLFCTSQPSILQFELRNGKTWSVVQ